MNCHGTLSCAHKGVLVITSLWAVRSLCDSIVSALTTCEADHVPLSLLDSTENALMRLYNKLLTASKCSFSRAPSKSEDKDPCWYECSIQLRLAVDEVSADFCSFYYDVMNYWFLSLCLLFCWFIKYCEGYGQLLLTWQRTFLFFHGLMLELFRDLAV